MRIDDEIDLHGLTSHQTTVALNSRWNSGRWPQLVRIRIIHGTGEVLHIIVREWLDDHQIPWAQERGNPGAVIARPASRSMTAASSGVRPSKTAMSQALAKVADRLPTAPADAKPLPISTDDTKLFLDAIEQLGGVTPSQQKRGSSGS